MNKMKFYLRKLAWLCRRLASVPHGIGEFVEEHRLR